MKEIHDDPTLALRYRRTLRFLEQGLAPPARLLDLGTRNPMSELLEERGYQVENTHGEDLDDEPEVVRDVEAEAVTAFEILEHLVAPLNVLRAVTAPRLFATVPLRLWFAPAYRNPEDPWDRHYHEFEAWQFDWLLEKAGWTVVRREKWTSPPDRLRGIRSVLRRYTPRYYAVEAVRRDVDATPNAQ